MSQQDSPIPGGALEYAVLVALWDAGPLTARGVHERVGGQLDLVYTTITKVLDRLHAKNLVERQPQGRAFVYSARIPRPTVERERMSQTLRRLIGPEPRPAIASLVEAIESIDPTLLDELAKAVQVRKKARR